MIRVKLVAPFELDGIDSDGCVDLPDGARVKDLLRRVRGFPPYARFFPVAVNGDQVKRSHCLKDGDTVVFIMPVSGG
ncbi:MAG: MoaD/ThiS family protein [Omnitrophica WOR_2 bacterium]